MKYVEISPSHPHIRACLDEGVTCIDESMKRNRTFHPEGRKWPLYSVSVWTPEPKGDRPAGFFVTMSVKTSMNAWWEDCGLMTAKAIPFELLPEVVKLIEEAKP